MLEFLRTKRKVFRVFFLFHWVSVVTLFSNNVDIFVFVHTNSNAREEEELFLRLAPRCPQHQRAGKLLTVKKTGLNKGRKFYACSLPRGA